MVELAVIADDFTGALDTGIKFAKAGMKTQVMLHSDFHFSEVNSACEVLVIDTETRHLKPESAYQIVYTLVKRCRAGHISRFYKKTDSALRGCIGKELTALCDALGESVEFIPALESNMSTRFRWRRAFLEKIRLNRSGIPELQISYMRKARLRLSVSNGWNRRKIWTHIASASMMPRRSRTSWTGESH